MSKELVNFTGKKDKSETSSGWLQIFAVQVSAQACGGHCNPSNWKALGYIPENWDDQHKQTSMNVTKV